MNIKKLDQKKLDAWVASLIEGQQVFGVQAKGDKFIFDNLEQAEDLRLDYDVTILPPKKYFLPPREALLAFRNSDFESLTIKEPFILLGVHPYDAIGIRQMDRIFSSENYDTHYMQRRQQATIIAVDPQACGENNFSGFMRTATITDGIDILLTKINSYYLADAKTSGGEKLLALIQAEDVTAADLEAREKVWEANRKNMRKHTLKPELNTIGESVTKGMNHKIWEEKAVNCFSCGSCVFVCPTCYCFDVSDELDWKVTEGKRVRKWDGCMLQDFATVAGDHNFRSRKSARFRHRYLRKAKYTAEKVGEIACVGCGRCISACVADIANPVEIFNTLTEVK